jgi:predicted O-methyltransferase YrrM
VITFYSRTTFLHHPLALARFYFGQKDSLHEVMMIKAAKKMLGDKFDRVQSQQALDEIRNVDFVPMNQKEGVSLPGNKPTHFFGKFLYYIVRCSKPSTMIETGVAHGVSSWTILNAMHKNGKGKLYSIDLPNKDLKSYNPIELKTEHGWVVPDVLRERWELLLGKSSELLPGLLDRLKTVDVFFHDSDHSYENMMYEFSTLYPYLQQRGLMISDDVHKNKSFEDFVSRNNMDGILFVTKGGLAVKK